MRRASHSPLEPYVRRNFALQELCSRPWPVWAAALILLFALAAPSLHAQGCTQCLDSTRATPPQVQSAYRHAIFLLGGGAVAIFVGGGLLLLKNQR